MAKEPSRPAVDRPQPWDPGEALSFPICKWACQVHLDLGLQKGQWQQKTGMREGGGAEGIGGNGDARW